MRGIKRTLVSLQRGLSSYWLISLLAPCMSQAWAQGDAAVSPRHQFQHSNGIWWGWERAAKNAEALQSFYLVDQGSLDSARTGTGQSQVTSVNYSLG
ncbi:MAG: hypothetical protein NTX25_20920, partial [Proteobacteria bacterium]|nr:hypothetical protein [Pseudomonadota bacterium]